MAVPRLRKILQPFTGNSDVSKWVKKFSSGTKKPNKRIDNHDPHFSCAAGRAHVLDVIWYRYSLIIYPHLVYKKLILDVITKTFQIQKIFGYLKFNFQKTCM